MGLRKSSLDMINAVDNSVQTLGRQTYDHIGNMFGDSMGGVPGDSARFLGELVHAPNSAYPNTASGRAGLYASRGLQAGGITAAGAGLLNLSHRMAETFGGTGDLTSEDTLYM